MRRFEFTAPLLICCLFIAGCDDFSGSHLVSACEDAIKSKLKAPSTYKRIEARSSSSILSRDEFEIQLMQAGFGEEARVNSLRGYDSKDFKPALFSVELSYDAANSFGVPLRSTAHCSYFGQFGEVSTASSYNVKLDM